jgi:hypothetical protein
MRKYGLINYLLLLLLPAFNSCQVIGDIFKAGVWSGVLLVVLVVGLIIFIITRLTNRNK